MTSNRPAQITCSCPACGAMSLAISEFYLAVHPLNPRRNFYQFTCPTCCGRVTKEASQRVVEGLLAHGVIQGTIPLEADEPHCGSPVDKDDLIDLMLELERFPVADEPRVTRRNH